MITDTDTNPKKFQDGYGYKKISGRIRIRMQKISRADTDTNKDTIFVVFTDTVSVDGYLYPSDPDFFLKAHISEYLRDFMSF